MGQGLRDTSPSTSGPLTVLGLIDGFRLTRAGRAVTPCLRGRRVLALLAVRGEQTRSAAATALWPRSGVDRAQGSLRTALWRLRSDVPGLLDLDRDRLALPDEIEIDVRSVVDWATRMIADEAVVDDDLVTAGRADAGELLPGWEDDWVVFERERLRQLRLHATEAAADRLALSGRHAAAIEVALTAIRIEPLRESAHRTLIRIHLAEGNASEARRHYLRFRSLLRDELGIEPSAQLSALLRSECRSRPGVGLRSRTGGESPPGEHHHGRPGTTIYSWACGQVTAHDRSGTGETS